MKTIRIVKHSLIISAIFIVTGVFTSCEKIEGELNEPINIETQKTNDSLIKNNGTFPDSYEENCTCVIRDTL